MKISTLSDAEKKTLFEALTLTELPQAYASEQKSARRAMIEGRDELTAAEAESLITMLSAD